MGTVVLALAVSVGCARIGEVTTRDADRAAPEYVGPARERSEQEQEQEEGWRSSEPDLGEGRNRDPLLPLRSVEPTQRRWRPVFADDFTTLDTSVWKTYEGVPGCCPRGEWDPSMVRVEGSSLFLDTAKVDGRWLSGGVGSWGSAVQRQYGRWDVRVRTDDDSLGVTVGALLWPAVGGWPPEIDFYEIFETEPDRRQMTITNHYGEIKPDGTHDATRRPVRADFSAWRVMSLRWTPDEIQVLMDGRVVETIRRRGQIPEVPMWLALQTAVKHTAAGEPDFTGVRSMEVDWVRVYEPA